MDGLHRTEAAERSRLLSVRGYDVELDMTRGDEVFGSVSRIGFDCSKPGKTTFLELEAARVESVVLNGRPMDASAFGASRITLEGLAASNELVVTADCAYSRLGEGVHRFVDPADGETYVWSESVVNNAGRIFGCFDQPDLKAPLRLRVRAPMAWTVLSTGAGTRSEDGTWEFTETPPLSTYLMVVCAGPWHSVYVPHG